MSKHFIYEKAMVDPANGTAITVRESLNMDKVIRAIVEKPYELVVLLDDGHEESVDMPQQKANGKGQEMVRKRYFLASQIILTGKDVDRFFEAISQ